MEAGAATASEPWHLFSTRQRWLYLAVLFLVSTSNYADRNIIAVLLVPIKQEFHVSDTMLGLLTGMSFAVFYATLGIPVARAADYGNRKRIMTLAIAVWSVMTMLCGTAQSFLALALARVGVGAGEAGAIPPAQSLIADYFAPAQRSFAYAVFMASATAGYLIGFVLGADVAATEGWRRAFLWVGAPGLVLAVIVHFVLREPRRQLLARQAYSAQESVLDTFRALMAKRSYVNLLAGLTIYFFIAYGAMVFVPTYLVRVAGMNLANMGASYGGISAVVSLLGFLMGGILGNRLSARNPAWLAWLPALGLAISLPFFVAQFLVSNIILFFCLSGVSGLAIAGSLPSIFAALNGVCGSWRRAMAVAVTFFFGNLIGMGLGPIVTGYLSDLFTAHLGPEGLRYALIIVMVLIIPNSWFFYRAGHWLKQDLED